MIVVRGPEQRRRLAHQPTIVRFRGRAHVERHWSVGSDVERHRRAAAERDVAHVAAGEQRRIDQRRERYRREPYPVRSSRGGLERRGVLPARRKPERRLIAQFVAAGGGRIQHQLIPFQDQQRLGRGARRFQPLDHAVGRDGRVDFEIDAELGRSGRNLEVKRVQIDGIAPPGEGLAVDLEDRAAERSEGTRRTVPPRQPLRVHQGQGAGRHGQGQMRRHDAARRLARVDLRFRRRRRPPGRRTLRPPPRRERARRGSGRARQPRRSRTAVRRQADSRSSAAHPQ